MYELEIPVCFNAGVTDLHVINFRKFGFHFMYYKYTRKLLYESFSADHFHLKYYEVAEVFDSLSV